MTKLERQRDFSLDRAKGIAMLLVAYGHAVQAKAVGDHPWYVVSKAFVYHFHMPLFMMISGYLFFKAAGHQTEIGRYVPLMLRRMNRLLVPFLAFAGTVILGKYLVGPTAATYDSVTSISGAVIDVIFNTPDNPVFAIWYLLVLFVYCAVTPILFWICRRSLYLVCFVAFLAYFISVPRTFYLDRTLNYYIFFVVGGMLCDAVSRYRDDLAKIIGSAAVATIVGILVYDNITDKFLYFGIVVSFLVLAVCYTRAADSDAVFPFIGRYAFIIYLLNTIAIGVGKVAWSVLHIRPDDHFVAYIFFLTAVGLLAPLAAGVLIDRFFGGSVLARYVR